MAINLFSVIFVSERIIRLFIVGLEYIYKDGFLQQPMVQWGFMEEYSVYFMCNVVLVGYRMQS